MACACVGTCSCGLRSGRGRVSGWVLDRARDRSMGRIHGVSSLTLSKKWHSGGYGKYH
ncbi:hypothetical protein CZ765_03310 [Corynebacterium casei]|nr:hypothetical protein CZ765_03310 [Corynebacterium casei]